jgi:hypothetical protein
LNFAYKKGLHLKLLEPVPYGLHYCTQHKDRSMHSIHKAPSSAGKATAAAVAVAVVACGACCVPLVTPLALALLASLGIYSVNDMLTNGWWLAAAAMLVLSPLVVWGRRKRLQRLVPPACATDCSCKTAGGV